MTDLGPLATRYLSYSRAMENLVPTVRSPGDWAPLSEYIAVDDFERVGVFCEVQDWDAYTEMLTGWAGRTAVFETVVLRTAEFDRRLYYEVEERHHRNGGIHVVNSMSVVEFGDDDKIRRLHIYVQRPVEPRA